MAELRHSNLTIMAQNTVDATFCCKKTLQELQFIAGDLYAGIENRGNTYNTLRALYDNTSGSMTNLIDVRSARPGDPNCTEVAVDLKYRIPVCGEGTDDCVDFTCTPSTPTESQYGYDSFSFDDCVSQEFTVDENLFNCRCEEPQRELAQIIATNVRQLAEKKNRKLIEKLAASVGSVWGGTQSTSLQPAVLPLFVQNQLGQAVPQPMGLYELTYQYQRMNPNSATRPVIISGAKKIGAYSLAGGIFNGNKDGQDASLAALGGVYMDWQLGDILATSPASDPAISFLPDSVQVIDYHQFKNPNKQLTSNGVVAWAPVKSSGTLTRMTVDVGTSVIGQPLVVDLQIQYEECENRVTYKMRNIFDLWCMPQGAFCAGDQHNHKLLWDVVCQPYDCNQLCNVPA